MGATVETVHVVMEKLASIAPQMPGDAIECLRLIAQKDKEGWKIYMSRNEARSILAAGLASAEPMVKTASQNLINWFGIRGMHEFRDLMTS